MTPPPKDPLRRLDDRIVPALAAFFDRLIPRPPEPTGPLPVILRLRRIDDRWTRRGPLALVREVPQLGALAIAAIVLASGVTVASRTDPARQGGGDGRASEQGPGEDGEDRLEIGPRIGEKVGEYIADSRQRLLDVASGQPDAGAVAVVSFAQYRTPAQVQDLLGPATVVRIFYRVPLKLSESEPLESGVTDVVKDSEKVFRRRAHRLQQEIGSLQNQIDTNEYDQAQADTDAAQRDVHKREVALLNAKGGCACIYAVLVQTRMRILGDLLNNPGVRVIDVSTPNARLGDYQDYDALLPEEKVTVTGGNQA